jgi:hypothetical protein
MKRAPDPIPTSCIESRDGSGLALCGRAIYASEFRFRDPGHAVENYATSRIIRACETCVESYRFTKALAAQTGRVAE